MCTTPWPQQHNTEPKEGNDLPTKDEAIGFMCLAVCLFSNLDGDAQAGQVIRNLLERADGKYVIVGEHDLSVLDYLSDYICCLYGQPGAYGVVTMPFSVREGSWFPAVFHF